MFSLEANTVTPLANPLPWAPICVLAASLLVQFPAYDVGKWMQVA